MKLYVLAFSAVRPDSMGIQSAIGAGYAFAVSNDEATGKAHKMARAKFPDAAGWGQWMVVVDAIDSVDIRNAFDKLESAEC